MLFPESASVFFGGAIGLCNKVWASSTALSMCLWPYDIAQGCLLSLNNQALFLSSKGPFKYQVIKILTFLQPIHPGIKPYQ